MSATKTTETKLLWSEDGEEPVGSVRVEVNQFDDNKHVLVPYEYSEGRMDFIIVPAVEVYKSINNQIRKIKNGNK